MAARSAAGSPLGGGTAKTPGSDCAAALANQKYHERSGGVIVYASDERIAAFDPMHEAVLTEELERSVGRDRRRARSFERQPLDNLVSSQRLVRTE